jgi:hypothetical protein
LLKALQLLSCRSKGEIDLEVSAGSPRDSTRFFALRWHSMMTAPLLKVMQAASSFSKFDRGLDGGGGFFSRRFVSFRQ